MTKLKTVRVSRESRVELHDQLGLTGCEVSINTLPAHAESPFVHYHEQNEEVYVVLAGDGLLCLDGECADIAEGDCFKVEPASHRALKAGTQGLRYICIQCRERSLERFTGEDARIAGAEKPPWPDDPDEGGDLC